MASDPTKPLLRLEVQPNGKRRIGKGGRPPKAAGFNRRRQAENFGPLFNRLKEVLARDPAALELRRDPAALAPETLLVFVVRESVQDLARAINQVPGLDFIDVDELDPDADGRKPVAYMLVPDVAALRQILSLWDKWQRNEELGIGNAPWRHVFETLQDLRRWGPDDRVADWERSVLENIIENLDDDERIRVEIELVYRRNPDVGTQMEQDLRRAITDRDGEAVSSFRRDDIAYHAILADLPVIVVQGIVDREEDGLAGETAVMHIRPQSLASSIQVADQDEVEQINAAVPAGAPILAVLDGVPIANHPLLNGRLLVEDPLGLEEETQVINRTHGTAMASAIALGDRYRAEQPLPRRILSVPVLRWDGGMEAIPDDRLIVDVIYTAVTSLRSAESDGGNVIIVNISLGNLRRPFHGQMSGWARLLDRLAWQYGILFVVSAGNVTDRFDVAPYRTTIELEADQRHRQNRILQALEGLKADRRIISPAETLNGLTVGAANQDNVPPIHRQRAVGLIDPFPEFDTSNPSSRLGPGLNNSVKPDVIFPGGREHLRPFLTGAAVALQPVQATRSFGIRVASPPAAGDLAREGYTNGTSAAAAQASRTAHRIHDALEDTYGEAFIRLSHRHRAVLLKALTCHTAIWSKATRDFIVGIAGPADNKLHMKQKDNVRRYIGYGLVDGDDAVACAADRATFWACGQIGLENAVTVDVPIPLCIANLTRPHALCATLAWFTPVQPGRQSYKGVRLNLLEPKEAVSGLGVSGSGVPQPDQNQMRRGTLISRRWSGDKAPVVIPNMDFTLNIQREIDNGDDFEEEVPFGLAVTVTMPGVNEIYEQVRQRLGVQLRPGVR
ncbi:MAG: S8 family peptidase [Ferrovibrio sp.]|uniref:S8 family peptidase n=1 Tax=Ferrovibrio sp. TaxID=1917215 RepID=UPI0026153012|nr:S8 family peptidase [Ferrovibrio sp.]MCW0234735.1 S8 family peptidase [Ferrovibrio sp.]